MTNRFSGALPIHSLIICLIVLQYNFYGANIHQSNKWYAKMLEEIRLKLKAMSCDDMRKMAASIGVSFDTLFSIRCGRIKDPKLSTALAIQSYFNR